MLAACGGDLCETLDLLISGAEVDEQDWRRWTALSHACWHGHYEIVQQLLDAGANPNVHESYSGGEAPLSLAAKKGFYGIVRLLIAHDADPNCYAGYAAVRASLCAREAGHHHIAEFLRWHEDRAAKLRTGRG